MKKEASGKPFYFWGSLTPHPCHLSSRGIAFLVADENVRKDPINEVLVKTEGEKLSGSFLAKLWRREGRSLLVKLGLLLLLLIAILLGLIFLGKDPQVFFQWIEEAGPLPFFAAMAILPMFGVPISPFFLLAGPAFGVPLALVGSALGLAANLILSYWLAASFLRLPLERLVRWAGYQIPRIPEEDVGKVILLVGIAPGIPIFLKNYLLGLAQAPFGQFMLVLWTMSYAVAVGFIILGEAIFTGKMTLALLGGALLLAIFLGRNYLRRNWQKPSPEI
ncbi:MAG: hypothetical protein JJT75_02385 [Opitutales bacterium]|nr:hypothetical protein [Opitutales bacterium]MCH8539772.1 VTT domain-containing protein [Opitutales bacterium]